MTSTSDEAKPTGTTQVSLPRISIKFCVQCKWNLRAAYVSRSSNLVMHHTNQLSCVSNQNSVQLPSRPSPLTPLQFAQELLQTFSTSIGEISLIPVTGGTFIITILHALTASSLPVETLLWDRKAECGFPETKELKNRVRNIVDPGKDMGHIDRRLKKDKEEAGMKGGDEKEAAKVELTTLESKPSEKSPENCEDCK